MRARSLPYPCRAAVSRAYPRSDRSRPPRVPQGGAFLAGCANGTLRLYEKTPDVREVYKRPKRFRVTGEDAGICCIALSPSEDNLVCGLSSGQAYLLGLHNSDLMKADEMRFEPLVCAFPGPGVTGSKAVMGLDMCVRKPLLVAAGADRTVRVYNYAPTVTNKPTGEFIPALELEKTFDEEAVWYAPSPTARATALSPPRSSPC